MPGPGRGLRSQSLNLHPLPLVTTRKKNIHFIYFIEFIVCSGGTSDPFPHLVLEAPKAGLTSRPQGDCNTIYNDNGMTPDPNIRNNAAYAAPGFPWFLDASNDPNNLGIDQVQENKCYHYTICGGRRNSWTDATCSSNKVNQDDDLVWWGGVGTTDTSSICELPYVVRKTQYNSAQ